MSAQRSGTRDEHADGAPGLPDGLDSAPESAPGWWLMGACALLTAYLSCVIGLGREALGVRGSAILVASVWAGSALGLERLLRWAIDRRARNGVALSLTLATATLVIVDVSFCVLVPPPTGAGIVEASRLTDPATWIGEVYPRLYWDPVTGVRRAKPGYTFSAWHYGDAYAPGLLAVPTLRREIFSLKHVAMTIDEHGFRNTAHPDGADTLTLGDSFTFGWGVDDDHTWVRDLERRLGSQVYNLGVPDSSPVEEVARLRLLLESEPARFHPRRVVWVLFEGNDLEDSRPLEPAARSNAVPSVGVGADRWSGTILAHLAETPWVLQRQSVIDRWLRRDIRLGGGSHRGEPWQVDGVELPNPVVHSPTHGHMMWLAEQLERARASAREVAGHPNHARLLSALASMAELARTYGFAVTLVVAPTAVRVYAPYVDDLDAPIAEPHLIHELVAAGGGHGFAVIDLLGRFAPRASTELLYFRDDDHWNERGHEVVAEELAAALS